MQNKQPIHVFVRGTKTSKQKNATAMMLIVRKWQFILILNHQMVNDLVKGPYSSVIRVIRDILFSNYWPRWQQHQQDRNSHTQHIKIKRQILLNIQRSVNTSLVLPACSIPHAIINFTLMVSLNLYSSTQYKIVDVIKHAVLQLILEFIRQLFRHQFQCLFLLVR